ncbi:MAG TPA: glycosyltransferase family 2 protein [Aggregatilinea sp.]|uniref:dolichyl-phosphate beta-glucosyltransferase n=1 Tax=Aggregatilinea sp. TaxID=2806333 RepID=UPI002D1B96E4|nr:dolichyl-phosphate beta-glucosyltransferase [Aggregatilinea sp.]HML24736.1 glycosyltransferase family 2 protein [Aggregatilinea sp.]
MPSEIVRPTSEQPLLSIVIPAYNEQQRLPQSLRQIRDFVSRQPYAIEVIVVDNNSTDHTRGIAEEFVSEIHCLRVLIETIQGKGAAVRTGMLAAHGAYRFICDADLSMPIDEVNKFLPPQLDGYDVAIGSREAPGAVRYNEPTHRHLMGRVFNTIVRLFAVHGFQDTQCGFKMFRADIAEALFPLQTLTGWSFDVEILYLAQQRGFRIVEVPVNWYYKDNTRIHPLRDSVAMFADVMTIRRRAHQGHYGPAAHDSTR